MKNVVLVLVCLLLSTIAFGQCQQKAVLMFTQVTEDRHQGEAKPMKLSGTITMDQENVVISIVVNGRENKINSQIKQVSLCEWAKFLNNGKAHYQVSSRKGEDGPGDNAVITVESVNGVTKVSFKPEVENAATLLFDVNGYTLL